MQINDYLLSLQMVFKRMINLSKQTLSLWGKKTTENNENLWLPLIVHMIDTKNVINWLYNHWLGEGPKHLLSSVLSSTEVQQLVNFLGYIHDIGKATPAFQLKQSYIHNTDLDRNLIEKLVRNGFTGLDQLNLQNINKTPHALAGEAILETFGLNKSVGAIIGGHHGKPQDILTVENIIANYTANFWQSDLNSKQQNRWKRVQKELIGLGLNLCGYKVLTDIPSVKQPQAIILEGLVIMADWIASCEYWNNNIAIPMFTLIPLNQGFKDLDMNERYKKAIVNWLHNDDWIPNPITNIKDLFKKRFGFEPYQLQESICNTVRETTDPGIFIIEAPMGIGKTEIALASSEQLAFATGRNGLFFGLPTQATSNAMFARVDSWLKNIAQSENVNLPIKLMHGKAAFNEKFKELPHAENIEGKGAVVINSWFTGKKSILNQFTIGTIDQLLLMGLKQKHLFLRHLGLSDKIVIIDEIHAYDTYMNSYLTKALEWLGAYHVPVIALSATLPSERRQKLIKAYFKGKYGKTKELVASDNWGQNQTYPLLTYLDGNRLIQKEDLGLQNNSKEKVEVIRFKGNDQELIKKVEEEIENGGIAGIVVNTIKRAQTLASLIPSDIPVLLLHSAFLATDREEKEKNLQKIIGKSANRPDKMIVIGTQVLEQSLDIDFDILFTDIAPIDLVLQRIGRLHRHKISRPRQLEKSKVYICGINSFGNYGEDNEFIYDKYLLMKTDYFLPNQITLPNDISHLVQEVYDFDTGNQIPGLKKVKNYFLEAQEKLRKKARVFQIKPPVIKKYKTIHGWLDSGQPGVDVDENRAQAAVRDIKETLEVILIRHTQNGDYLLNGEKIDKSMSSKKIARQIIRLPFIVTVNIEQSINELETITAKNYPEWQQDEWLHGSLAFPLDEDNNAIFNGWKLHYSSTLGLSYQKLND